jgi:hypothetical protein
MLMKGTAARFPTADATAQRLHQEVEAYTTDCNQVAKAWMVFSRG